MCLDLEHAIICMSQILGSIHVTGVSAYLVFGGLCFFFFFFRFLLQQWWEQALGMDWGSMQFPMSFCFLFFFLFPSTSLTSIGHFEPEPINVRFHFSFRVHTGGEWAVWKLFNGRHVHSHPPPFGPLAFLRFL